jgi:hypothetical protein
MKLMELVSRRVLSDAQRAWQLLEDEEDPEIFRIYWVAAITLCRSVGQVLDKVDCRNHPEISDHQRRLWTSRKNEAIFSEFIDAERNALLKEYIWNFNNGSIGLVALEQGQEPSFHVLGENLFCPIRDGKYAGEDCRDILHDALKWWDSFLAEIETL